MGSRRNAVRLVAVGSLVLAVGCARYLGDNKAREANKDLPGSYGSSVSGDGPSAAAQKQWDVFFSDPDLQALIEQALQCNQELNIRLQEIIIAKNEAAARRGDYLPRLDARAGAGIEKVGKHTSQGASDEDHGLPQNLPDFNFGLAASWEVDIWGRLRNSRKAAQYRYLASIEGKNFVITQIVAEIANSYWDLVALDEQIDVLDKNIELQQNALEVVKLKKAAARETELGVQRVQAEVLKNQSRKYNLEQQRIRAENRINFLVARLPRPVKRNSRTFMASKPDSIATGLPADLLDNRPDVRAAKMQLEAAKLDTKAAKARFYPALSLEAGVGYESFNARHLLDTPDSLAYNLAGNLVAPLLNRAAIKADYRAANARQVQAVYNYERTLIGAYTDVANQLAAIENLTQGYEQLSQQVDSLEQAIDASNVLYRSARADYAEVLMTRRDSLEAQMELIETKKQQMQAMVDIYQALGGGWRGPSSGSGPGKKSAKCARQ